MVNKKNIVNLLMFLVILFGFTTICFADDRDICRSVMEHGIYNKSHTLDIKSALNLYSNVICTYQNQTYENFNTGLRSGSLGLDVPLAESILGINANANQETKSREFSNKINHFCNSIKNSNFNSSNYLEYQEKINNETIKAWDNCEKNYFDSVTKKMGVFVYIDTPNYSDQSFTAHLVTNLPGSGRFKIDAINPEGIICTKNGEKVIGNIIDNRVNSFDMTCKRGNNEGNENISFVITLDNADRPGNYISHDAIKVPFVTKTNATTYYERGNELLFKERNYINAIECYTQAITLNPEYSQAYYNRGNAKRKIGRNRFDDAINDYNKTIELNGDCAGASYSAIATIYRIREDWERAISYYDQAINIDRNDTESIKWRQECINKSRNQ